MEGWQGKSIPVGPEEGKIVRGSFTLRSLAREHRKNPTESEELLWTELRCKRLGSGFRRQRAIGQFIVDFYCPEVKMAIEVDGAVHEMKEQRELDRGKEAYLTALGIYVLRIRNEDLTDHLDWCLDLIGERIYQLKPSGLSEQNRRPGRVYFDSQTDGYER